MSDVRRLIEAAFPLKQASIDSVHEKNVRHGHISTLHIWPARRPLAACRAALIATLLPDPGTPEERRKLVERIGGTLVEGVKKKRMPNGHIEEIRTEETLGGVLHWGRESSPDMDWFRAKIREAYSGRAPRVLDPFAGGGAIPLEAMRLGCETTAIDINPVSWFILKCTLEYPQKLAGQTRPLPEFILKDRAFMEEFLQAQGFKGAMLRSQLAKLGLDDTASVLLSGMTIEGPALEANLAWHVRAWGRWVLDQARADLAQFYPTYAEFQSLAENKTTPDHRSLRIVPLTENGFLDRIALNAAFSPEYLADGRNPRWLPKPSVAYLWARTVNCKHCRATVPLLKTRWLSKRADKRIVLTLTPNFESSEVVFGIENVPVVGTNAAQRREYDKRIGAGTMSRSGVSCACCRGINSMEDLRAEGRAHRLGLVATVVVVDGPRGREYRLPDILEHELSSLISQSIDSRFSQFPFGIPAEPIPKGGNGASRAFSLDSYGFETWSSLFLERQLLAVSSFGTWVRRVPEETKANGYPPAWQEALFGYMSLAISRLVNYSSGQCCWHITGEKMQPSFLRFALPIVWDIAEVNPLSELSGGFFGAIEWLFHVAEHLLHAAINAPPPEVVSESAIRPASKGTYDIIITDPPYYDAIPYSDLMDFFYVWLRRITHGMNPQADEVFSEPLGPKWNHSTNDGELIDDAERFGGDRLASKQAYETGMARALSSCNQALRDDGKLILVFAHKHPNAWETLVTAVIQAGFVVDGSWPIRTEMGTRMRAHGSAALSSSVWLVCKKRPESARPGWDNRVLDDMREKITTQLREFWDAGIRGPDFVWAATGPALEAYSKHPVVRKVNAPGELMKVSEFLGHVRRMVVDFVVGRVLSPAGEGDAAMGLDAVTAYYLLHRHDFGLGEAPIGACILYAVSCGLADRDLADKLDLISHAGGASSGDDEDDDSAETVGDDGNVESSSAVKLKAWNQRKRKSLGVDDGSGLVIPLIDQIHRLMQLWQSGSVVDVNAYLDERGLRSNSLFPRVLQALVELAGPGTDERAILETIAKHVRELGEARQFELPVS